MGKLCDIVLKVDDKRFPAHRIVLAACSDNFCAMFTGHVGIRANKIKKISFDSYDTTRFIIFIAKSFKKKEDFRHFFY